MRVSSLLGKKCDQDHQWTQLTCRKCVLKNLLELTTPVDWIL